MIRTFPLNSISIEDAKKKQFKVVDCITKHFKGSESLSLGDLGVRAGINKPLTTRKVEEVIADIFDAEECTLVRGAGTNAIRLAVHAATSCGAEIIVHSAPIYPTTLTTFEMFGLKPVYIDYNDASKLDVAIKNSTAKVALVQLTRQQIQDNYDYKKVIATLKAHDKIVITDDNYAVMKVDKIGCEVGADLTCFSCFKLLGPEGIGAIVGNKLLINKIVAKQYSGGSQVQGFEAMEVLRGLTFAPVLLAVQSQVNEDLIGRLNNNEVKGVKNAFIANAQSKVVIVELLDEIAEKVIVIAETLGALPNPVGAESKYELAPMFYKVSGTFLKADPTMRYRMIRINPNRSGADTIIKILSAAIEIAKRS